MGPQPSGGPHVAPLCFPQLSAHPVVPMNYKRATQTNPPAIPGSLNPACSALQRCENSLRHSGSAVKEGRGLLGAVTVTGSGRAHTVDKSCLQFVRLSHKLTPSAHPGMWAFPPQRERGDGTSWLALQSHHFNTSKKGLFPNGWEIILLPSMWRHPWLLGALGRPPGLQHHRLDPVHHGKACNSPEEVSSCFTCGCT